MHSSRQKKKISQQKKRHHDRVKAKGGAADTPACNKEHRVDNDTAQPQQIVVQPPAPLPQAGASKKNKPAKKYAEYLGSNWDRYEESETTNTSTVTSSLADSQEQLEQRLIQLLNLPIHHAPPASTNTSLSLIDTMREDQEESPAPSFLKLDCATLAAALSTLPLHKRLDISLELIDLCQDPATDVVEQNEGYSASPLENFDLNLCTRKKKFSFEFKSMGDTTFQTSARKTEQSVEVRSQSNIGESTECYHDNELDRLLERNLVEVPSTSQSQNLNAETVKEVGQHNISSTAETSELDDMLDELLL